MKQSEVAPATGKLGIMVVGCGAVSTTFITGVLMARKGLAKPIGAMTQYDKIRVGKNAEKKYLHYKDIVPLAELKDIVFATWDVYPQNAYQATIYAEVCSQRILNLCVMNSKQYVHLKLLSTRITLNGLTATT